MAGITIKILFEYFKRMVIDLLNMEGRCSSIGPTMKATFIETSKA